MMDLALNFHLKLNKLHRYVNRYIRCLLIMIIEDMYTMYVFASSLLVVVFI